MLDLKDASIQAIGYAMEMEQPDSDLSLDDCREAARVAIGAARHDARAGTWTIGVGFARPWDVDRRLGALAPLLRDTSVPERRTVKHVRLDDETGQLVAYY